MFCLRNPSDTNTCNILTCHCCIRLPRVPSLEPQNHSRVVLTSRLLILPNKITQSLGKHFLSWDRGLDATQKSSIS